MSKLADVTGVIFTTEHAPGAWPNGTRVVKSEFKEGDGHAVGALATVIGSVGPFEGEFGYFVRWDDRPTIPVFVVGFRLARAAGAS